MNRIPYMKDLVDYLMASPILNGHGLVNVPDLNGGSILVKARYYGIDEDNQISPSVWIIPMDSRPTTLNDKEIDCRQPMVHRLMLCSVVKNAYGCRDEFDLSQDVDGVELFGGFVEASKLEELLRDTILKFNKEVVESVASVKKYRRLRLVELAEPDEHNGHVIMPMIFELDYIF